MSDDVLFRSFPKFHREEDGAIDARVYFVVERTPGRTDSVCILLIDERGVATVTVAMEAVPVSADIQQTRNSLYSKANELMAQYQQVDHLKGKYL